MTQWTNLQDIMQDLSVAQGCVIPVSLQIYTNSGPPQMSIDEEESEEQAYYKCDGGEDFTPFRNPDFNLIQQMLNIVKQNNSSEDKDPTLTSDLDPLSPEYVPVKVQNKINKNVALSSILKAKNTELAARRPVPNNVIPVMFKRKSSDSVKVKSDSVSSSSVSSPDKCKQYTPTTQANEYYSKYLEKSKLREQFEEDIWTKSERKMKEIDARKKKEAEVVTQEQPGFHTYDLPDHRHRLTGECVVCSVASKHGYNFRENP